MLSIPQKARYLLYLAVNSIVYYEIINFTAATSTIYKNPDHKTHFLEYRNGGT